MSKLGVMGGTFNPIHYGHLVAAEEALFQFSLDHILFLPSGKPPHKVSLSLASAEDRYQMVRLATCDNERFSVSRYEIDKSEISYTVDTMTQLKSESPNDDFFFITGADAILEILTWKKPDELLEVCTCIAATRPGYPLTKLKSISQRLGAGERVKVMKIPALTISSTDIRRRVKTGRPIKYLVPSDVEKYIHRHRLYF